MRIREIEVHVFFADHKKRKEFKKKIDEVLEIGGSGNYSAEITPHKKQSMRGVYKIDTGLPVDIIRSILQESKVKNILVFCPDENVEERIQRT